MFARAERLWKFGRNICYREPSKISPVDMERESSRNKVGDDASKIIGMAASLRSQAESLSRDSEEEWSNPDQNGTAYRIQRGEGLTSVSARSGENTVKVTFGQEEGDLGIIATEGNLGKAALLIKNGRVVSKGIPHR